MARFTHFSLAPRGAELTCEVPDRADNPVSAAARIEQARHLFGPETSFVDFSPRWKISEEQMASAIDLAVQGPQLKASSHFPEASFHFSYHFAWTEFEKNPDLFNRKDSRNRTSRLTFFFRPSSLFIQPDLVFPASWESKFLRGFLLEIEQAIPFRFRDQYFQRWLAPKDKKSDGRTLKLASDWRGPSEGAR